MARPSPLGFEPRSRAAGPFLYKVFAALSLQRQLFESAAAERQSLRPAAAVVCLAALVRHTLGPSVLVDELGAWGLLVSMLFAVIRWLVFTSFVYGIARLFVGRAAGYGRLLRCLGFAEAPAMMGVVAFLLDPSLYAWIQVAVSLWLLAATVVAVRAALAVGTARATAVGVLSFVLYVALGVVTNV
jgi:hypothetical protein